MTEAEIRQAIADSLRGIAPEVDLAAIPATSNMREALDIDSFDFLNLLIGLHTRLSVEIPEADYGKLTTLAEMIEYLKTK